MTESTTQPPSPLSRLAARGGAAVLTIGGLTGAGAGVMAAFGGAWTRPDTFVVFFGLCSLIAGALGVLVLAGRFRETVGMTLLIGAGILLVGGALSEAQLVARYLGQEGGEFRSYFGVRLVTLMQVQLACAGVCGVLCAVSVWLRRFGASLPHLVRALICFAVLGGVLACFVREGPREAILALPKIATALAVIVGGVLGIVTVSIGGHATIRSFEAARG